MPMFLVRTRTFAGKNHQQRNMHAKYYAVDHMEHNTSPCCAYRYTTAADVMQLFMKRLAGA